MPPTAASRGWRAPAEVTHVSGSGALTATATGAVRQRRSGTSRGRSGQSRAPDRHPEPVPARGRTTSIPPRARGPVFACHALMPGARRRHHPARATKFVIPVVQRSMSCGDHGESVSRASPLPVSAFLLRTSTSASNGDAYLDRCEVKTQWRWNDRQRAKGDRARALLIFSVFPV
jgi:hypothetical protein